MNSSPRQMLTDYFHFEYSESLTSILQLMTVDCSFYVETHGVKLQGLNQVSTMLQRLWDKHAWVKYDQSQWVEGRLDQDIAVRFNATNKLQDGTLVNKSNCNFFPWKTACFLP